MGQDTIIYIDEQDKHDASAAANSFADKNVKNRVYINTLGADLAMKYLASENINVSEVYNMHSIKKILEELDISDVMLPNIHIDVRVIFDENLIFIPKSHFIYDLVPDIYLVFALAKDFSHVKFSGFFEPKLINKNNQNKEYYFIEKEKLNPPSDLKQYIENFNGNTTNGVSEEDIQNSERIIMAMCDNDISEGEKQYLIKQLTKSAELRDKFIEYENFETLSYKAMTDPQIIKKEIALEPDTKSNEETIDNVDSMPEQENLEFFDSIENFDNLDFNFPQSDNEGTLDYEGENTNSLSEDITENTFEELPEHTEDIENIKTDNNIDETLNIDNQDNNTDSEITISQNLVSSIPEDTAPITLDTVDTTEFDNAVIEEPKSEEEIISFDNIETPEQEEKSDFINEIDNKISFDDIDTIDTINEDPVNIEEPTISLTDADDVDNSAQNLEEETLSLDDLTPADISNEISLNENLPDTINLEEIPETESFEENILNEEIPDENNIDLKETLDSIENLATDFNVDETNSDNEKNEIDTSNVLEEISEDLTEGEININSNAEDTFDVTDSQEVKPKEDDNESFGKNLLENLSEENSDIISFDELGIEETQSHETEHISSDELLSQIDDILGSNSETESTEINSNTMSDENISQDNSDLSNIPDIDTLLSDQTENFEDSASAETTPDLSTAEEINPQNETPAFAIDDILNTEETQTTVEQENSAENLEVLFNDNDTAPNTELNNIEDLTDTSEQPIPGAAFLKQKKYNTKIIIAAAALITVLAGVSAFTLLKPKAENTTGIEPVTPAASGPNNNPAENPVNENVLETNTPTIDKKAVKQAQKTQQTKELTNTPANQKPISSESYLDVKRLVWDVPDFLSYSPKIQNYLRTAGKSIKLSLSADLLLATEYAYSNQVKISLKLSKDGNIQEAKIVQSSGSGQIDNIVLQSVKDTLNVVKPPANEISTPDFNLNLIIYF